jgi:hypothetical protein
MSPGYVIGCGGGKTRFTWKHPSRHRIAGVQRDISPIPIATPTLFRTVYQVCCNTNAVKQNKLFISI